MIDMYYYDTKSFLQRLPISKKIESDLSSKTLNTSHFVTFRIVSRELRATMEIILNGT